MPTPPKYDPREVTNPRLTNARREEEAEQDTPPPVAKPTMSQAQFSKYPTPQENARRMNALQLRLRKRDADDAAAAASAPP